MLCYLNPTSLYHKNYINHKQTSISNSLSTHYLDSYVVEDIYKICNFRYIFIKV